MIVGNRFFLLSESGQSIEITDDMVVGRGSNCDITLDQAKVSRRHARLLISDQGITVEDLKSANGTYVQGERIDGAQLLHHGDAVRFGPCSFKFEFESADPEPEEDGDQRPNTVRVTPLNQNLPPAWIDDGPSQTQVFSLADIQSAAADPDEEELLKLEARIDAPTLLILTGDGAGKSYKLQDMDDLSFWTIGKGSSAHEISIVIEDPSISDFHAKLAHKGGRWKIVDQMSTNHTYVNGEQYNSAFLSSRDVIRFGAVNTLFLLPGEGADQPDEAKAGMMSKLKGLFK